MKQAEFLIMETRHIVLRDVTNNPSDKDIDTMVTMSLANQVIGLIQQLKGYQDER